MARLSISTIPVSDGPKFLDEPLNARTAQSGLAAMISQSAAAKMLHFSKETSSNKQFLLTQVLGSALRPDGLNVTAGDSPKSAYVNSSEACRTQ